MKFKRHAPDKLLVLVGEELSDELAKASAALEAVSWELDSALSSIRKDAAGYRNKNAANPDGGECYTPGELEEAVRAARRALLHLIPFTHWAQERDRELMADAARKIGGAEGQRRFNLAFLPFGRAH